MSRVPLRCEVSKTTRGYPYPGFESHVRRTLVRCVSRMRRLPMDPPEPFPKEILLEVACLGSRSMARLNQRYRSKRDHTDILSFRFHDPGEVTGSLALCEAAIRQKWRAEIKHHGLKAVYARLLVHGFAHLLGFDHQTPAERKQMERFESDFI